MNVYTANVVSQGPLLMKALYSIQKTKSDNKAIIDNVNVSLFH